MIDSSIWQKRDGELWILCNFLCSDDGNCLATGENRCILLVGIIVSYRKGIEREEKEEFFFSTLCFQILGGAEHT